MFDNDKGVFPISVVANELGVHQRTLRIYDDVGILKPKRSVKNRRLYSFGDINKGKLIQYMTQEIGLNISGVKAIFLLAQNTGKRLENIEDYKKIMKLEA